MYYESKGSWSWLLLFFLALFLDTEIPPHNNAQTRTAACKKNADFFSNFNWKNRFRKLFETVMAGEREGSKRQSITFSSFHCFKQNLQYGFKQNLQDMLNLIN